MIASPSDLGAARDAVEDAIGSWNAKHAESAGVVLLPWRWESSSVPGLSAPAQTLLNRQGVDRSDIVIALVGARIGTATPDAISGTVEEIDRARARGIPVHLYFSQESVSLNSIDTAQLEAVRTFRSQIQRLGLYGEFGRIDDLREQVDRALSSDVNSLAERKADAYFEADSDRVVDLHDTRWVMSRGSLASGSWSARVESWRSITSKNADGIERFVISLGRESDKLIPFGEANLPSYRLLPDSSRSDGGSLKLLPPHKSSGGSFAQYVEFDPPLDPGESAHLHWDGFVPNFKFSTRELFEPTTRGSKLGLREWDYVSFPISAPVARFIYSVFIPDELRADFVGVKAGRGGVDTAESHRLRVAGHASVRRTSVDGVEGSELSLDIERPHLKWTYRLCWRPPSQGDLDAGAASPA
ncbi:hypothetical protein IFT45_13860 [Frigoribacterium sp. CFBP 13707]|nr:DUF4062 domain-containing protein [Frigoribacterium sp. CFBP 13707]MBD8729010.1 hypothetical protein [Frigoribacterium sp. CFBP 13707]